MMSRCNGGCQLTCPIHVLWVWASKFGIGQKPWVGLTPGRALTELRHGLLHCGVDGAQKYRTHDLRRGHAKDLQLKGASLYQILAAGEWRSPAFLSYLDLVELERDVVIEAHLDESSSEDEQS